MQVLNVRSKDDTMYNHGAGVHGLAVLAVPRIIIIDGVYTAGTGTGFLATGKPSSSFS